MKRLLFALLVLVICLLSGCKEKEYTIISNDPTLQYIDKDNLDAYYTVPELQEDENGVSPKPVPTATPIPEEIQELKEKAQNFNDDKRFDKYKYNEDGTVNVDYIKEKELYSKVPLKYTIQSQRYSIISGLCEMFDVSESDLYSTSIMNYNGTKYEEFFQFYNLGKYGRINFDINSGNLASIKLRTENLETLNSVIDIVLTAYGSSNKQVVDLSTKRIEDGNNYVFVQDGLKFKIFYNDSNKYGLYYNLTVTSVESLWDIEVDSYYKATIDSHLFELGSYCYDITSYGCVLTPVSGNSVYEWLEHEGIKSNTADDSILNEIMSLYADDEYRLTKEVLDTFYIDIGLNVYYPCEIYTYAKDGLRFSFSKVYDTNDILYFRIIGDKDTVKQEVPKLLKLLEVEKEFKIQDYLLGAIDLGMWSMYATQDDELYTFIIKAD